MENLTKKQKIVLGVIVIFMLCVIGYYFIQKTSKYDNFDTNIVVEEKEEPAEEEKTIIVHITGEIEREGIVNIEEGARISDVINKSGGITLEADLTNVNLAYIVKDGQKIYIPSIHDKSEAPEIISEDGGDNVIIEGNILGNSNLVNINTATQTELETLTGVRTINST